MQFECTDAIKTSGQNPIVEGSAQVKPPEGAPAGFGFSCLREQKSEQQEAQIPAGVYMVSCVLAHNNIDPPRSTVYLEDNKTYEVTFSSENNGLCTAKIGEKSSPREADKVAVSSTSSTSHEDSLIIKDYFLASIPAESNYDEVEVKLVENPGKNNLGVYKITSKNDAVYFAKLCTYKNEPEMYRQLQPKIQLFNTLAEDKKYPAFAKYAGTFTLPKALVDEHFKEAIRRQSELRIGGAQEDVEVLVLEAAKGEPLTDLIAKTLATSLPEIKETFENIGETIGNFMHFESQVVDNFQSPLAGSPRHLVGYGHGDLNSDNVFYDKDSKKITLIDYKDLTDKGLIDVVLRNDIDNLIHDLTPLLQTSRSKDDVSKIKAVVDSYQRGVETAFKDSPQKLAIVKYYMTYTDKGRYHPFYDLLRKYFKVDELPNFKEIKRDFNSAIRE